MHLRARCAILTRMCTLPHVSAKQLTCCARAAARAIGERAVRRAAAERAHEELLSQERKMLQGSLTRTLECVAVVARGA